MERDDGHVDRARIGLLKANRRTCPNLEVPSVQAAVELALPMNEDKQSFVWGAMRKTGGDLGEHSSGIHVAAAHDHADALAWRRDVGTVDERS